jgi:uncharacterized protein involved in exopolysaccharide biosynthesis
MSVELDAISFAEIYQVFWRGKYLIILITAVCTVAAALAAWKAPRKYEATVLIAAASNAGAGQIGGGLGAMASQLSGLASLAGLAVGGDAKKEESLAVLQSEALTEAYIRDNNLLPVLYAGAWDPVQKDWRETDPKKKPSLWKASRYFKQAIRKITVDSQTGLIQVRITWTDPELAAKWANELVALTNQYLRDRAIRESETNIAYLTKEAERTELVGARQAIYALLQNEINKAMMARGDAEYAFKVLDPATTPEVRSSPQTLIWIGAGMFVGLFLAIFIVFFRATRK